MWESSVNSVQTACLLVNIAVVENLPFLSQGAKQYFRVSEGNLYYDLASHLAAERATSRDARLPPAILIPQKGLGRNSSFSCNEPWGLALAK